MVELLVFLLFLFSASSVNHYNLWIPSPPCIETGHCPEPQKGDGYIGFEERTILNLINQARLDPRLYREQHGLGSYECNVDELEANNPIIWNPKLTYAAKWHAHHMGEKDCFQLDGCKDCAPFESCSSNDRIKHFYLDRGRELIGKGGVPEVLNSWLRNDFSCQTIFGSAWSEIGVGQFVKDGETYWSVIMGTGRPSVSIALPTGTHEILSESIEFSVIYNDFRVDEGLKESLLFLSEYATHTEVQRTFRKMGTGATGYYTLKIPFATLQKFDKEGRADTATGCHYYYFRFAREHSYTLVRLPEEGYFALTGYNGCEEIYLSDVSSNHLKKLQEEEDAEEEERRILLMEKEKLRQQRVSQKQEEEERTNWFYWIIGGGLIVFIYTRRRRFRRMFI